MSEKLKTSSEKAKKQVAIVLASLAMGAGATEGLKVQATASHAAPKIEMATQSKDKIAVQRHRETVSFQRFGKNTRSLPRIIDATLKANYPTTSGFLPGQTARYSLTVGDGHHGSTTLRTVYSKGKLHALTFIENFDDPNSFRKLNDNDEYLKMVRENGGWRVEKNIPATNTNPDVMLGSAISTELIPGYSQLPTRPLSERQNAVTEINTMNRNLEVFVADLQQFGMAPEKV